MSNPDEALVNLLDNNDTETTEVVTPPSVAARKRDDLAVDEDGDGLPSPGDILAYTIWLGNDGGMPAGNVVMTDMLDSNLTLIAGSVSTSHGTIIRGNAVGDSRIRVAVETLAANGGSATIRFRA